jgi:hypothetical protein
MLAFVSAFVITTIIHESGHFISYLFFGAKPVLYHNYVQTSDVHLSTSTIIISAMAGPVFSLLQAVVIGTFLLRKPGNSDKYLLLLWMCLLGFINFFGYLMLTPVSKKGDTGKVAELLGLPVLFQIIIAIAGLLILIFVIIKIGKQFANFIPAGFDKPAKGKYINAMVMFPIIAGSIVNILLAFPVPVILSIIYPATSSYAILSSYGTIMNTDNQLPDKSDIANKLSTFLVIVSIIALLLNRILTLGVG